MRQPRPWHLFFLVFPYGAAFGFVSVALTYLARKNGVDVDTIGAVIAMAFVPHAYKFLWAPLVDATLSRKAWYLGSAVLVSLGTYVSACVPLRASTMGQLTATVVVSQIGLTLLGMACEGFVGHDMAPALKSAGAAWLQVGTFAGSAFGSGAGLELVARRGGAFGGAVLGAVFLACAFPALLFDSSRATREAGLLEAVRQLRRDLWSLARSRTGIVGIVLCRSPIGAGAASNLFAAIANEWHASTAMVVLATGTAGSIVSAAGASLAIWAVRRTSGRVVYVTAGALTAASAVAMAAWPRGPLPYAVFTLIYQLFNGLAFAAFSAFAFEIAGGGSVVTKYNVMASLTNLAVVYSTRIDAKADATWGASGLLVADASLTAAGILVLGVAVFAARRPPQEGAP